MKPNLYMDFDGTLVSNKKRLYQFYIDHIPDVYQPALSLDEFWELKRMGIHELDWLNMHYHAVIDKALYDESKKREIETPHYLQYEELLPHTLQVMNSLRTRYRTILVSRRSNPNGLYDELERFNLRYLLDEVCVLPHDGSSKDEFIRNRYDISKNDILVGDTEDDATAGSRLGVKTYLVLSGIRREWIIAKFGLTDVIVIPDISYL